MGRRQPTGSVHGWSQRAGTTFPKIDVTVSQDRNRSDRRVEVWNAVTVNQPDWELRLADAWASIDQRTEDEFLELIGQLAAELPPDSGVGLFERAASLDSTGHADLAVPLYRQALQGGLTGERRRRAVIQLASSLRNLGQAEESVVLLTRELDAGSDHLDDAVRAFLALALVDTGRARAATALALEALAPHLPRYQRSLANYARHLGDDEPRPS
jgi:tetratricopeptide (TPR) repeat protein